MFQYSSASRKFLNYRIQRRARRGFGFQYSSASRKFLNAGGWIGDDGADAFQYSSASRKFLNALTQPPAGALSSFQYSSASRKFLNQQTQCRHRVRPVVSVLFSEPKIPQSGASRCRRPSRVRFSTLQRAENSSIGRGPLMLRTNAGFSTLQRAENSSIVDAQPAVLYRCGRFSTLQRAENSSMGSDLGLATQALNVSVLFSEPKIPQCHLLDNCGCAHKQMFQYSSASRKFLNLADALGRLYPRPSFSTLQRAENSSIVDALKRLVVVVAFQYSSASRKFLNARRSASNATSVPRRFSTLQRAENSSIEA